MVLSDAVGATILAGTASTLIGNDDTGLTLTALGGSAKYEGDTGVTNFTYRIERLGSNTDIVTVDPVVALQDLRTGADLDDGAIQRLGDWIVSR